MASEPHYSAISADRLKRVDLGAFEAAYDRQSGITHLLADPAPALLDILGETHIGLDAICRRLQRDYDLVGEGEADLSDIVAARLDELADLGLVERRRD